MILKSCFIFESRRIRVYGFYKKISRNDAYMNVANVEDDEDVIDLLAAQSILKHIKLIILLSVVFGASDFWN